MSIVKVDIVHVAAEAALLSDEYSKSSKFPVSAVLSATLVCI